MMTRLWAWITTTCWKCGGKGYVLKRGERIPNRDLTRAELAEYLVQGGPYFRAVQVTCPRCGGTGRRST